MDSFLKKNIILNNLEEKYTQYYIFLNAQQLLESMNYTNIITKDIFICSRLESNKQLILIKNNKIIYEGEVFKSLCISCRHFLSILSKMDYKY